MGDRCYLSITCSESDREKFEELGLNFDNFGQGIRDDVVTMTDDEANYGLYDELNDLAEKGVVFIGYHGEGSEYSGAVFASDGDSGYVSVTDCHDDLVVCVHLDWSAMKARPSQGQLREVEHYMRVRRNAERKMGSISRHWREINAELYARST